MRSPSQAAPSRARSSSETSSRAGLRMSRSSSSRWCSRVSLNSWMCVAEVLVVEVVGLEQRAAGSRSPRRAPSCRARPPPRRSRPCARAGGRPRSPRPRRARRAARRSAGAARRGRSGRCAARAAGDSKSRWSSRISSTTSPCSGRGIEEEVGVGHTLNVSRSAPPQPDRPMDRPAERRSVGRMTPEEMLEHCLAKPGAWPDNPWDHEHPVVKVHDKIFAFIGGDGVGREVGARPRGGRRVAGPLPRRRQRDGLHRPVRLERPALRRRDRRRGAARGGRRVLPAGGRQAGRRSTARRAGRADRVPHLRNCR